MDMMEKLLKEEEKAQARLKKIKEQKEEFEKKIMAKIPILLQEKYPDIYNEIREAVISKSETKKTPKIEEDGNLKNIDITSEINP